MVKGFNQALITQINAIIAQDSQAAMTEKRNFSIDAYVQDHTYVVSFIAIPDVEGDQTAAYLVGYIRSDVLKAIEKDNLFIAAVIILLTGIILLFLFRIFKRDEEIKEQNIRFHAMFNQHTTVMLLIDPTKEGRIMDANNAACRYYGYTHDEIFQKPFHDLCAEPELLLQGGYADMLQEGSKIYNFKNILKNTLITDVEVHATLIPFHRQKLAYLIVYDVTEKNLQKAQLLELNKSLDARYQLEHEERKKLETYFSEITKNTFDAILSIDDQGRVLTWNRACEKVLGYTKEEIIGEELHKAVMPQEMYPQFEAGFREFQKSGDGPLVGKIIELSATHKNGRKVPVEVSVNAVFVDGTYHAIGIIRDLTEKKRIERERVQKEKLLTQQSKMAEMGNMLNAIVHQWKQPLQGIMLMVQALQDDIESGEKVDPQSRYFSGIEQQIRFLSNTMNDFRNYFKPSKSKALFSVRNSIGQLIEMMHKHYEHSHVKIQIQGNHSLEAFGYDNEFKQVILNLLNNSRDALVEQKRKDGLIKIHIGGDKTTITVTVEDNAGGIPRELLPEKLFESYVSTKGEQGTGIGLSMSKTIIEESMDGELSVYNTDTGACFTIRLPLRETQHDVMDLSVLYVEDEEIARQVNARFLKKLVKNLLVADDGESAYDLYQKNRDSVQLLITDYNMPGMDGVELLEKIQQDSPEMKVIMMTAFKSDLDHKVNADIVLMEKPVRKELLIKMIRLAYEELNLQDPPVSRTITNM